MFQYYIKIVPTTYTQSDGSYFPSNQFSVTRHSKVVSVMAGEGGMPGVFFSYEMSPVMVKYSRKEKSLGHFFVSVYYLIPYLLQSYLLKEIKTNLFLPLACLT